MRVIRLTSVLLCVSLIAQIGCDGGSEAELENDEMVAAPTPPPKPFEARVAEVGVGIKGQSLRDETGVGKIIAQPVMTLFTTKEKIAFEIQLPNAMNVFEALNGRKPETHEEFMQKIIKENQIPLPKLPQGQVYRYHTDDAQLWVEPEAE